MSSFLFDYKTIYYEVHGRGEPLVILNGIFMTCTSWTAFIPSLSQNNQLILVDLLDQGRSTKMTEPYRQEVQVEVVHALLDHLGIGSAHMLGISYGGEIAMQFALRFPSRVRKLILANTTAYTSPWLEDMGNAWQYALRSYDGRQFFKTCIPVVYSPDFYSRNIEWARKREELFLTTFTKETYDAFLRLIESAEGLDLRQRLTEIDSATLVISSEFDYVTPLPDQELIVRSISSSAHVLIKGAGHASMYEKPVEFVSLVLGFIHSDIQITIV